MAKSKKTELAEKVDISLKSLLEAGCHFGHQSRRWNPKMEPYLYTVRDGIHIFDLAKTKEGLEKTINFVRETAAQGGQIIFVGTKRQARAIIKEEAQKVGVPYVSERWLGGTLTNWTQVKKSIDKFTSMVEKEKAGEYKKYTKKEQLLLNREIRRLERFFGSLVSVKDMPAALFIVDTKKEIAAVREARKKGIPVIAIVDSNSDPSMVDYVIPANDDAVGSVKLIVSALAAAVAEGKKTFEKKAKKDASKEVTK
jgi:small subunit ribosomal protein S2